MKNFDQLKKLHRELRNEHEESFRIRIHRALSWLKRAEQEKEDTDAKFIFIWISFNGAYSIQLDSRKNFGDVQLRSNFFITLIKHGQDKIHDIIYQRFDKEIRSILDNEFILTSYWDGIDDWQTKLKNEKKEVQIALRSRKETGYILSILFKRLYVLRNQIFHGGATWQGNLNRQQVRDGANLLSYLVPVMLEIMMKNPKEDWGTLAYPPTEDD